MWCVNSFFYVFVLYCAYWIKSCLCVISLTHILFKRNGLGGLKCHRMCYVTGDNVHVFVVNHPHPSADSVEVFLYDSSKPGILTWQYSVQSEIFG